MRCLLCLISHWLLGNCCIQSLIYSKFTNHPTFRLLLHWLIQDWQLSFIDPSVIHTYLWLIHPTFKPFFDWLIIHSDHSFIDPCIIQTFFDWSIHDSDLSFLFPSNSYTFLSLIHPTLRPLFHWSTQHSDPSFSLQYPNLKSLVEIKRGRASITSRTIRTESPCILAIVGRAPWSLASRSGHESYIHLSFTPLDIVWRVALCKSS